LAKNPRDVNALDNRAYLDMEFAKRGLYRTHWQWLASVLMLLPPGADGIPAGNRPKALVAAPSGSLSSPTSSSGAYPTSKRRAAVARQHEPIARLGVWAKVDAHVVAVLVSNDEVV
jgi:hypothetical protein